LKKFLLFLALSAIFLGCGAQEGKKLFVYNWAYYIPNEVIEEFQKTTGITVIYDVYSSNEEMYAKLKAGATGYDVVFPSDDIIPLMIQEEMLEKLDHSLIPNLQNVDKNIIEKAHYDKGLQYTVPYVLGATGIAVNKKYVKNYPKDFSIFERSDLKGKMSLLDEMKEVLGSALLMLNYPMNSVHPEELAKAKALVLKYKKNILKFDAESYGKGFATGEYWVSQGYAENIMEELDDNMKNDVEFFIPQKGCQMYVDSITILKSAPNKENAYKFINFIHKPQVFAKIMDFVKAPCINIPAQEFITEPANYQLNDMKGCQFKEDMGDKIEIHNKIWQEIMINE